MSFEPALPQGDVLPVSAIVPTVGRIELLRACLASILDCHPGPAEVVVVDQSGGDDVRRLVADLGDDRVVLVRSDARNISTATNLALITARYDAIAGTHDDCTVATDWVSRAWAHHLVDPAGIATGRVLPVGDARNVPSTITSEIPRDLTGTVQKGGLFTNNMVAPRLGILEIGGFDERSTLRLAAEDNDLCYRWLRAGRRLRYEPDLVVCHHDWRSSDQLKRTYIVYARGQGAFYGKHLARGDLAVLQMVLSDLGDGVRASLHRLSRPSREAVPTRRESLLPWLLLGLAAGAAQQWSLALSSRVRRLPFGR